LGYPDNLLVASSGNLLQLEQFVDVEEAVDTVASVEEDWETMVVVA
jgi:hypothetical protein